MSDRDIVVTWPKKKPLGDYLAELRRAHRLGLVINYRVAHLPQWDIAAFDFGAIRPRCYIVYAERVRGWNEVLYTAERGEGEVEGWPAGRYIVRGAEWHEIDAPRHYPGFRGWRWYKP